MFMLFFYRLDIQFLLIWAKRGVCPNWKAKQ